ncbi:MAG: TraB/GumN family protein [Candidatus Adiutrix sp.]|jgi:uncharacterized protein YbaP (TraB family)|nr:TraB/GumN family protein [Candidatus Adiutrix sp.]
MKPALRPAAAIFAAFMPALVWASGLSAANFVWSVQAENGARAYLMGSIHLAHESLYPLADPILAAFAASQTLVVEINTVDLDPAHLNSFISRHGLAKDGRPLAERLTPETARLLKASGRETPQMTFLAPWLAALKVQMEALTANGYQPQYGLDLYFINQAKTRRRPIIELETLEEQMSVFTNMSEAQADLFLRVSLLEAAALPDVTADLFEAWRRGDPEAFADCFFREYDKYPELTPMLDQLIFRRNERMFEKIERLMSDRSFSGFIVVGAGHLPGPEGLIAKFNKKNYSLTQL